MNLSWLRNPRLIGIGRGVGYIAFGIVAFLVSVVLTFPTGRLLTFLESRLSQPGGVQVRMDEVSLRGLGSASLRGVKIEFPADPPATPEGPRPEPKRFSVDRLDVSVGLFRLLLGDLSVSVKARNGDGTLGPVSVVKTKEEVRVDIPEIQDFPLPPVPVFGVRFAGKLSGKGNLVYNLKEGLAGSTGRLELNLKDAMAVKPSLKVDKEGGVVTLGDVDLGNATFVVNLDKKANLAAFKADRRASGGDATVIHLEKAEIDGQDAKALVEGHSLARLFPGKPVGDGQINVEIAFSLNQHWFDRKVKTGKETETPNKVVYYALEASPTWKAAQSGGYWGVLCSGSLSHPSCLPKKPSIRGGDFKPPAKEEAGTGSAAKTDTAARPTPRSVEPRPAPSTPVAPRPSAATEDKAVESPAAGREPASEPSPPPTVIAPPSVFTPPPKVVVPTVIGRGRIRSSAGDDGESPAGPPGSTPPAGTVAPGGEAPTPPTEEE